ncbi:MAG: lipid-A-disaccharide synthase N-terminal domain-containing protein [Phycisphaerae bacterium]|jgi:lipid-A-disaccharide synthase-like uncharacterized protein
MSQIFSEIWAKCDGWALLGFIAQMCFASRFAVQWIASEKRKESVVPVSFWYLSIIGGTGLLIYAFAGRKDPIFILGYLFNNVVYIRNLMIIRKAKQKAAG